MGKRSKAVRFFAATVAERCARVLDARAEALARLQAAEAAMQRAQSNVEQATINNELNQAKYERAQNLIPTRAKPIRSK